MTSNNNSLYWEGSLVFARVKGHPYWPAEISEITNSEKMVKYKVTFFGDNTTAFIKQSDLCLYSEYKHIHGKPKIDNFKNKGFNSALELAETASHSTKTTPQIIDEVVYEHDTTHSIVGKIQNLENSDKEDLNLSLTLAAEAGNALLQENITLKAEKAQLLEKCMRLEAELMDTTEELEKMRQNEEKHQSKAEKLHQELANLQNQIDREKQNQLQLQQLYEDYDNNQHRYIKNYESKIVNLEKTIKSLKTKPESESRVEIPQTINTLPTRETAKLLANTCELTDHNLKPSFNNDSIIQDIINLKTRQDQMENSVKILQNQIQNCADKSHHKPVQHIHSGKNKTKKPNSPRSISPQMTINEQYNQRQKAPHTTPIASPQRTEPKETAPMPLSETDLKLAKYPPLNSKPRAEDETCEEFFSKHILFYRNLMAEHCDHLTEKNNPPTTSLPIDMSPYQRPDQQCLRTIPPLREICPETNHSAKNNTNRFLEATQSNHCKS